MSDQRYLVAARKYRPKLFREIVAQEHVTDTLKNAIRLDRLAHAYLFSGPRGVGKTTAARVLAKAVNCETPREEREDQSEPCRQCDSCQSFEQGQSLSVFEFDAASNRKVEDIQPLLEKVRVPPQGGRKKVYIVDEVHMLSKHAFNAFLKTLEEPPAHALFIFATTEPHKVLPTILSRCQRFDFNRIPVPRVVERLREICEAEDITADDESLMLLAQKGNGALRDALSAFDQAVSLCGTTLEYADLAQAMGVVDRDLFFQLTDHVAHQNSAGVLELVEHVVREGYDLQEFLAGLAEHLRNLLVAHTMEDDTLIEAAEATRTRYAEVSQQFTEADLLRLLTIVGDAEEDVKGSSQPRLKLEMALLRMAALTRSADLREALDKIDRLEQMARQGKLPDELPADATDEAGSSPATSASSTAEPASDYDTPEREPASTPAPSKASESPEKPPKGASPEESEAESDEKDDSSDEDREQEEPVSAATDEPPAPPTPSPSDSAPEPSDEPSEETSPEGEDAGTGYRDLFGEPALPQQESSDESSDGSGPENSHAASLEPNDEDGGVAAAAQPGSPPSSDAQAQLQEAWPEFVRAVHDARIRVGSFLQDAHPVALDNGAAKIAVPRDFHRRQLSDHRSLLLESLEATLGQSVNRINFVIDEESDPSSNGETTEETDPYERMRQLRQKHPALDIIFDDFGGELMW